MLLRHGHKSILQLKFPVPKQLWVCVRVTAEANSNIHNKNLSSPKEGSHIICREMDRTGDAHIKRVKSALERHVCFLLLDFPRGLPILTTSFAAFSKSLLRCAFLSWLGQRALATLDHWGRCTHTQIFEPRWHSAVVGPNFLTHWEMVYSPWHSFLCVTKPQLLLSLALSWCSLSKSKRPSCKYVSPWI